MALTKYASFAVQEAWLAPGPDQPRQRVAHRHQFTYTPRPGYLYVRSRAISSRCNDNFDEFPADEIRAAYRTFIGKPVFVNHHNDDHRRARGVIIDAALHDDVNPDGTDDVWAEVLMEVDAVRFPKLAQAILAGEIDRTSMGTDVAYSKCSFCGNKAATPLDYCSHIPKMKGQRIRRVTGSGPPQDILVREICYGLGFFENSLLVEDPADPTAYFLGVDDRGIRSTAATKYRTPEWDEEEEADHPREQRGRFTNGPDENDGPEDDGEVEGTGRRTSWTKGTGEKDDPVETDDVEEAADALTQGLYVELLHAPKVCTLLDKLAEEIKAAEAAGTKTVIDLCKVTVQGTNLFCVESKGIPRIQMPQLKVSKAHVAPGSRAEKEVTPNEWGEYDIQALFAEHLKSQGISVQPAKRKASHLKATQSELNAEKIAKMVSKLRQGESPGGNDAIFVSRDDYIVDGHHRWGANVSLDWEDGNPEDIEMDVQEVDMGIIELLAAANRFADEWGVKPAGVGVTATKRPCGCNDAPMTVTASRKTAVRASLTATMKYGPGPGQSKTRYWRILWNTSPNPADFGGTDLHVETWDPAAATAAVEAEGLTNVTEWEFLSNIGAYRAHAEWDHQTVGSKQAVLRGSGMIACDLPGCTKAVRYDSDAHNFVWEVSGGYMETWDFCSREHQAAFERMFPEWREMARPEMRAKSRERTVLKTSATPGVPNEIPAPEQVDTMRDESCPVCGEKDSYDGQQCSVCQFIKPPEMFNDPDLDKAKEQDLRQDQEAQGEAGAVPPEQEQQTDADPTFTPPADAATDETQPDEPGTPDDAEPEDEDAPEDEDEEEDEDGKDGSGEDKPGFVKKKKKSSRQVAASEPHGEGADVAMRPNMRAVAEQQARLEGVEAKVDALCRLAGLDLSVIDEKTAAKIATLGPKQADVENPAQPIPEPAAEAPVTTTQEEIAPITPSSPEGGSLPDSPTDVGAASVTDVSPDATTSLADTGVVLDEPLDLNEQDVTAPVAGTTEQRPLNETKIETDVVAETGDQSSVHFPITPAFSDQPKTTGAKNRTYAALHLARLRLAAEIAEGEDLSIAEEIDSSDMADEAIAGEIETLSKVVTANRQRATTAAQRPRGLVPVHAAATDERTTPGLSEVPSMESLAADARRVQDDEVLFEG